MNKLFQLKFGSHLYGTNTENSDLDLKSIYLPSEKQIILGKYDKTINTCRPKAISEHNNKNDIDIEIFSLDKWLKLMGEGQTVCLDMLFAPDNMFIEKYRDFDVWEHIQKNKDKLVSKDVMPLIGYCKQQAQKYGLKGYRVAALEDTIKFLSEFKDHTKLKEIDFADFIKSTKQKEEYIKLVQKENPKGILEDFLKVCDKMYSLNCHVKLVRDQIQTRYDEYGKRALLAQKNEGCDWKALSHAVRVNSQGIELLNTGNISFPRPDREILLDIKLGKLEYNQVADIILMGQEMLMGSQANSSLRDKPDYQWIEDFVYDVYKGEVNA